MSAALDALLARDADATHRASLTAFAERSRGRPIVLMGAGGLGQRTARGLQHDGVRPLCFADNNLARHGSTIEGLPVLAPADAAARYGATAAFVVTIWGANSPHRFQHTRAQLESLGCDVVLPFPPLFWVHADALLPFYSQDLPHKVLVAREAVRAAEALWHDEASRAEYLAQVRFRLDADFDGLPHPVQHPAYFPDDLYEWRADEWIVDGGAYDGDTVRALEALRADRYAHVLALEPDPANFTKLQATVAALPAAVRSRYDCRALALASQPGTLHLEATGTAASATSTAAGAGTVAVPAVRLDDILDDAVPTLLKLDIEGAEPDALLGAERTIRTHAPVLAVCVYHVQNHLWRIPLMLKAWRDDYTFFLRPHNEEGWDLVCYAIPRHRLRPELQ